MNNKIKIPISFELANYANRLMFEDNNLTFIMCRLFEKHKNDDNADFLASEQFKKYHKELETIHYEYTTLRNAISSDIENFLTNIGVNNPGAYQWNIPDFVNDMHIEIERRA